eukprot:TRINITY_DN6221_c0_g2_i1.p1 TRINITY_DN6221_c0_g2~~TRINITY_DN6221_c0_g2_i1.p1  ORF type:complete len:328 (+),score=13.91 TRINITY_DN6221_c0_g2_i1:61-1044(+)
MSTSDGATEAEVTISPLPSSQPSQSPEDNEISRSAFLFAVGGYMLCSSLMLLVNKFAVHSLPAPSTVILVQLLMSSGCMLTARYLGFADVLPLKYDTVRHFFLVALTFLLSVFANMKTLQAANVETFIVFRASTPLVICVLDYIFLGRELPSAPSWGALLLLAVGAVGYVYTDKFFEVVAYIWVCVWFTVFCFDQIYIKHVITTVKMNTWSQVYYTNTLAAPILTFVLLSTGELGLLIDFNWTSASVFWMVLSAVMGVAVAYFSFLARNTVSATYFTVIGNVCKVLTVVINVSVWDNHATPTGIAFLMVSLVGAYVYQQAPLRKEVT